MLLFPSLGRLAGRDLISEKAIAERAKVNQAVASFGQSLLELTPYVHGEKARLFDRLWVTEGCECI